jgi:P-type conjugative transfer protein TrbJ
MIKLRHLAAASAVALSLSISVPPASAQWIVYDPTNFSQNVLTAARGSSPRRPSPSGCGTSGLSD